MAHSLKEGRANYKEKLSTRRKDQNKRNETKNKSAVILTCTFKTVN